MIGTSHQTCIYRFVHSWHQNVDCFEYMQVLCTVGSQNHAFFPSHAGFGEVLNLQRVCNFEVNKAQIKNGIRF